MNLKFFSVLCASLCASSFCLAAENAFFSPDKKIQVVVNDNGGNPSYKVSYDNLTMLENSPLGINTNIGDFTQNLSMSSCDISEVSDSYQLPNIKQSSVDYHATQAVCSFQQDGRKVIDVIFRVSNRDVAFRYKIYEKRDNKVCVVNEEASGFCLPQGATTFLCPQSKPMGGFARTSPSYETSYSVDQLVGRNGWGEGYSFPCLFKVNDSNWVLISETGVDGNYVASRLLNVQGGFYKIGFPQQGECNGFGSTSAAVHLPCETPWRTITVGPLANIVETTVPFDLVKPKYEASQKYTYGKGSWSWIIGMDSSCNFDEQKRYIDFSAAMGYQTVLIDALWDVQIGRDKIKELADYGKTKGVGLFLWYNSNGSWNDAPQSPIGKMDNNLIRRQEMAWMKSIGIRGIKVDFFGGDKQNMMQLYENILADANDYGIMVIFHGCTLPRGWERMYPNYVASEAVLASENLHFGQGACDNEAFNATLHPFIRNTVGSMDFGGSALNKYYNADNAHGTQRRTSDVYALATAVLFQSCVQHFALAPNNLTDAPDWAIDFMKSVPTTWDETRFIDGYPGKYVIMARRHGSQWFIAGVNAQKETFQTTVNLPMFQKGDQIKVYSDDEQLNGKVSSQKVNKKQQIEVTIPNNGAVLLVTE